MKIAVPAIHLPPEEARQYASEMLKAIGLSQPEGFLASTMVVYREHKPFEIDGEISSLIQKGRANHLQRIHDEMDEWLGPAMTVGVGEVPNGVHVTVTSTLGDISVGFKQLGIVEDVGDSLANDIEQYRNSAAGAINDGDMLLMARDYRAYLGACISMIDYFLYRYESDPIQRGESGERANVPARMEDRISAWIEIYCPDRKEALLSSKEYHQFGELTKARNSVIHPKKPMLRYEATEVHRILNLSSLGVGGLLRLLRLSQGKSPYFGFINQVYTMRKLQKA